MTGGGQSDAPHAKCERHATGASRNVLSGGSAAEPSASHCRKCTLQAWPEPFGQGFPRETAGTGLSTLAESAMVNNAPRLAWRPVTLEGRGPVASARRHPEGRVVDCHGPERLALAVTRLTSSDSRRPMHRPIRWPIRPEVVQDAAMSPAPAPTVSTITYETANSRGCPSGVQRRTKCGKT